MKNQAATKMFPFYFLGQDNSKFNKLLKKVLIIAKAIHIFLVDENQYF